MWKATCSIFSYIAYTLKNGCYDWDFADALRLFEWKLKRLRKEVKNDIHHLSAARSTRQIDYALYLLDNIIRFKYEKKLFDEHHAKWGETTLRYLDTDIKGLSRVEEIYPNNNPQEAHDAYMELVNELRRHDEEMWTRFWRHLGRYMRYWWT